MAPRPKPSPIPQLSRQAGRPLALPTGKAVCAEHAELVGTLQSGTSLTHATELEFEDEEEETLDHKHGVVFLLKYNEDGPFIDSALDVSPILGLGWQAMLAAEKLTGQVNKQARELASHLSMLRLRSRLDGGIYGPYLIKFPEPMDIVALETFLQNLPVPYRKKLLKGAQV